MNKKWIIIALIFILPIAAYWGLTRDRIGSLPSIAAEGDCVIKFSSPMCYECQQLEKVFKEVIPKYDKDIKVTIIDITKRDKAIQELIKEYNVTLVPTTVFKNQDGRTLRRIEGSMDSKILEGYLKELINE